MKERTEKELNKEKSYQKKMEKLAEVYKLKTDFASKFTAKPEKTKGYMEIGDPAAVSTAEGGAGDTGTGTGTFTGDMPTIANYAGPNAYHDPRYGGLLYQDGLRMKLEGTDKWNAAILKAGNSEGINPVLIKVLMAVETGGNHSSTPNFRGCVGLMQVKISEWSSKADVNRLKNDPEYNILIGTKHIKTKVNYLATLRKKSMKYDSVFKAQVNVHGVAWMYNGYHIPSSTNAKNKWNNGLMYADQIGAMYEGFGLKQTDSPTIMPKATTTPSDTATASASGGGGSASATAASVPATMSIQQAFAKADSDFQPTLSETGVYNDVDSGNQEEFMPPMTIPVKIGTFDKGRFNPPVTNRIGYAEARRHNAFHTKWKGYRVLDDSKFVHFAGPQENYYASEAADAFEFLLLRTGWKRFKVLQGTQRNYRTGTYSMHSAGIAMDIAVDSIFDALYLADTAWGCGFRAIAIGGEGKFVHIDCGPQGFWAYGNQDVYKGPGTFKIRQ